MADCVTVANELLGTSFTAENLNQLAAFESPPGCYRNTIDGNLYFNGIPNGANTETTTAENYVQPNVGIKMICSKTHTTPIVTTTFSSNPCELFAAET